MNALRRTLDSRAMAVALPIFGAVVGLSHALRARSFDQVSPVL